MEALLDTNRPHKTYPHLEAFMEKKAWELPVDGRRAFFGIATTVLILATLGLTAFTLAFGTGTMGAFVLGGAILVLGLGASFKAMKVALRTPTSDEVKRIQAFKVMRELRGMHQERKLHKKMDPVALQVLEAGAYHWARCTAVLDRGEWSSRDLPEHWQSLRTQAKKAADEAMQDMLLMAGQCVGDPQRKKEDDIKGVFRDFVDLDIADALMGLKQMANADWTAYAHRSPQLDAVFPAARETAEKLQALADELEAKDREIAQDPLLQPVPTKSIDAVLGELRAVQQAEDELDQEHLGQG